MIKSYKRKHNIYLIFHIVLIVDVNNQGKDKPKQNQICIYYISNPRKLQEQTPNIRDQIFTYIQVESILNQLSLIFNLIQY